MFKDILGSSDWVKVEFLDKGWSEDQKFYIEDVEGRKYLLRLSTSEKYEQRKRDYQYLGKVYDFGVPVSKPVDFGVLSDGTVYSLLSWIEGEEASAVFQGLEKSEQYKFGLKAGRMQKEIHKISAPDDVESWGVRYRRKIDLVLKKYLDNGFRLDYEAEVLGYIRENTQYLENRVQTFQHGDYHLGNMLIRGDELYVIDFNRSGFGDPWEEYDRFIFSWEKSVSFANGQIHGYFDNDVPDEFFRLITLYSAVNIVASIPWARSFGDAMLDTMMNNNNMVYKAYNGFKTYIPVWYEKPLA